MPGWDDVIAAGQRLPGVQVTTSYGTPALKVRDKLICRLRTNPDALVTQFGCAAAVPPCAVSSSHSLGLVCCPLRSRRKEMNTNTSRGRH